MAWKQRQPRPLDFGHAVLFARHAAGDGPFAVLLPDKLLLDAPPCFAEPVEPHGRRVGSIVAGAEAAQAETVR